MAAAADVPAIRAVTTPGSTGDAAKKLLNPEQAEPGLTSNKPSNVFATKLSDVDIDAIDQTPSVLEFKKLRNVMGQITAFYKRGSNMKKGNVEKVDEELAKIDDDEKMIAAQLSALEPLEGGDAGRGDQFRQHPKAKEYKKNLLEEQRRLGKVRTRYEAQRKKGQDLYEWSLGVVECCEWLESFLHHYCKEKLDLPEALVAKIPVPRELSLEERDKFSKALDEITFNLAESQDFFQASVDGRLRQYHLIELEIINAQQKALAAFPEDSPRRQYVQTELDKDLQYLASNMKGGDEDRKRKELMLQNHKDFFKALRFPREKLRVLLLDADAALDRVYDSQYDLYQDDSAEAAASGTGEEDDH
jgi:hypothetical protein